MAEEKNLNGESKNVFWIPLMQKCFIFGHKFLFRWVKIINNWCCEAYNKLSYYEHCQFSSFYNLKIQFNSAVIRLYIANTHWIFERKRFQCWLPYNAKFSETDPLFILLRVCLSVKAFLVNFFTQIVTLVYFSTCYFWALFVNPFFGNMFEVFMLYLDTFPKILSMSLLYIYLNILGC